MNLDIEKERIEFLNFAPAPLPGYWCERQEREFAVWCAAKARATPSPAPIQQAQQEDKATVEWITEKILSYTRPETPRDHEAAQRCARVIRTAFDRAGPTVKASQSDTHPSATARNEKD